VIVFVHGIPETARIWDGLRSTVASESVALSMPGFGTDRPPSFSATMDGYLDWLRAELSRMDEPVDLVGHDWGAILAMRVALDGHPSLRSWVADLGYGMHPDYVWHDLAQTWQTEGDGERFWYGYLSAEVEDTAAAFEPWGVPREAARSLVRMADDRMASSILELYRSATPNPHVAWSLELAPTESPGLILDTPEDPFGSSEQSRDVARELGARCEVLAGLGHWWMLQDLSPVAVLERFWADVAPA